MNIIFLIILLYIRYLIHSFYAILYKVIDHQLQIVVLLARPMHSIQSESIKQLLNILMVLLRWLLLIRLQLERWILLLFDLFDIRIAGRVVVDGIFLDGSLLLLVERQVRVVDWMREWFPPHCDLNIYSKWFKDAWRLGWGWGWRLLYREWRWFCWFGRNNWTPLPRQIRILLFTAVAPSLSLRCSIPFSCSRRFYSADRPAESRCLPFSSTNSVIPQSACLLPLSTVLGHWMIDLNMNPLLTLVNEKSLDWLIELYGRYLSFCSTISFSFLRKAKRVLIWAKISDWKYRTRLRSRVTASVGPEL